MPFATPLSGALDAASRHCVSRFCLRAACYAGYTMACWLALTGQSLPELASLLQFTFMMGAIAATLVARRFGERLNSGPLNHWDEGAALYILSVGARILQHAAL